MARDLGYAALAHPLVNPNLEQRVVVLPWHVGALCAVVGIPPIHQDGAAPGRWASRWARFHLWNTYAFLVLLIFGTVANMLATPVGAWLVSSTALLATQMLAVLHTLFATRKVVSSREWRNGVVFRTGDGRGARHPRSRSVRIAEAATAAFVLATLVGTAFIAVPLFASHSYLGGPESLPVALVLAVSIPAFLCVLVVLIVTTSVPWVASILLQYTVSQSIGTLTSPRRALRLGRDSDGVWGEYRAATTHIDALSAQFGPIMAGCFTTLASVVVNGLVGTWTSAFQSDSTAQIYARGQVVPVLVSTAINFVGLAILVHTAANVHALCTTRFALSLARDGDVSFEARAALLLMLQHRPISLYVAGVPITTTLLVRVITGGAAAFVAPLVKLALFP